MRDYKNLNIDYFHTIDTKDKAYWLGFLYADGAVNKLGTRLMLNLSIKDESQIDRFLLAVGLEPTIYKKYYGPYKNTGRFVQIYITNKEFVQNLIKQGCTNRKTFTIRFPELDDELAAAFLLGYYDGDGTASSAEICCGSTTFLLDIKTRFNISFDIRTQTTSLGSAHYLNLGSELKRSLIKNFPQSMERKKLLYPGDKGLKTSCYSTEEYKEKLSKRLHKRRFEISKEELEELIATKPMTHIGKMFGVSANAIKKRAQRLGIILIRRPYNRKK